MLYQFRVFFCLYLASILFCSEPLTGADYSRVQNFRGDRAPQQPVMHNQPEQNRPRRPAAMPRRTVVICCGYCPQPVDRCCITGYECCNSRETCYAGACCLIAMGVSQLLWPCAFRGQGGIKYQ